MTVDAEHERAPRSAEPRLPLGVVVIATVVALAAAVATYIVLDDGEGPGSPATGAPPELGLTPAEEPLQGDDLAAVTFQDLGGTTTALADLRGRPVVLNFFASWCTPCLLEMPAFERVHDDLGDHVTFVGLAVRDRPEDIHRIVDDTGVTYRIGRDLDERVMLATGALGPMPSTVLLDEEGVIVEVRRGELDEAQLRDLLATHFGAGT